MRSVLEKHPLEGPFYEGLFVKRFCATENFQPVRSESDPRAYQLDKVVETLGTREGYCPGYANELLQYVNRLQEMSYSAGQRSRAC